MPAILVLLVAPALIASLVFLSGVPGLQERVTQVADNVRNFVSEDLLASLQRSQDHVETIPSAVTARDSGFVGTRRVALVVGNGAYKHALPLANPVKDARDMAAKLRDLDFDVMVANDLDRDGLFDKVNAFHEEAGSAAVSLFFYAGHGMQVDGANYLVPVDAQLKRKLDVTKHAMKLGDVMDGMGDGVNLVFLDACRNNPLAEPLARSMGPSGATRGLAPVSGPAGTLIAYAAGPGQVAADGTGDNSPYTTALLEHIDTPGVSINDMLTRVQGSVSGSTDHSQVPWTHTSLTKTFYFRPVGSGSEMLVSGSNNGGPDPATEMWEQVRDAGDAGVVRDFLTAYPDSRYASAAQALLARLSQPLTVAAEPAGARVRIMNIEKRYTPGMRLPAGDYQFEVSAQGYETAEDLVSHGFDRPTVHRIALDVDRRHLIRSIQEGLNAMGFTAGQADGELRQQTRGALSAFLSVRGLGDSGLSENVRHVSQARGQGYQNFLGCVTERNPRTARESRQVPRVVTEWADESETLTYRAQDACNPLVVCGYHFDRLGQTIPNYGSQCDQACTNGFRGALQASGIGYRIESDLEQQCEDASDRDDGRKPSLERFRLQRCKCPSGKTCHCDFRATCEYEVQEESTEYETVWEENTVFEEEEVCRCRAPEVATRDCVRAGRGLDWR